MGDQCNFAHSELELRSTPNLYKTALCNSFMSGECKLGEYCRFAHGEGELRMKPITEPPISTYFPNGPYNNNGFMPRNYNNNMPHMENNFRNNSFKNGRGGGDRGGGGDKRHPKSNMGGKPPNSYGNNRNMNMMNDYQGGNQSNMNGHTIIQQPNGMIYQANVPQNGPSPGPGQQVQYYTIQQSAPIVQTPDGSQMMISYANTPPGQYQLIQGQNGQLIMINPQTNAPVDPNSQGTASVEANPQVAQQQKMQLTGSPVQYAQHFNPNQGETEGQNVQPQQINGQFQNQIQQQYSQISMNGQQPNGPQGQMGVGVGVPVQTMK